ncbi:hypothetical protein EV127DRAFT_40641 [Xylaria flabelliformis]|nr:hypothetical protein EV127DRAFT_40641 [Xylaria flabelliformis]
MAIPRSRASARELVRKITKDHGFVSPERLEQLETFDSELQRDIEEALLTKDKMIGSAVLTLATNLYTSKARFLFELLQNADDNTYSKANKSGVTPYVAFHVHPGRIVVECNEDGFTDKNLAAICAIGKSSKAGAQGYIGEKGIGFKSVFMAASKVHIQSGVFSFSFKHKNGDSGMGMISPVWEETNEELPSPLTRFTLHLHDDGDTELIEKTRQSIQTQFEELQETLLLFMKNLGKIHVVLFDETSQQTSSTTYSIERPRATYAILKKTRITQKQTEESVQRFHVTTHEATNLAKNENRTYSDIEETTRAYAKSQIVLAFPLSESETPIVEPQDLFVFLPVRPVGFKFLIQADFVTDANRQDVVQDSLRNSRLIDSIADAFIKAILQFCEHDTLRFQWMRYLPKKDKDNKKSSGLWLSLIKNIERRLIETPILYGRWHTSGLRLISDLCRLTHDMIDEDGDPLFYDESPGKIISQSYSANDLTILTDYGLRWCSYRDVLDWVTKDLKRATSRMKTPTTSEDWHSRVARLLNKSSNENRGVFAEFKRLELIPIDNDIWVSGVRASIYFHNIGDLKIPSNTNLCLVAENIVNADRLALFTNLGVTMASVSLVRKSIFRYYDEGKPDLRTSEQHLKFLYLTEKKFGQPEPYKKLILLNQDGKTVNPAEMYVYIANDDPHGPWELSRPRPEDDVPGLFFNFVHQTYFENSPAETQDTSWVNWFYDKLEVEKYVDLWYLKEERDYIQTYRPEKFLGTLYEFYRHKPSLGQYSEDIRNTAVLCRGNRKVPLKETYFPTTDLVKRAEKFLGQDVFFPWLQLEFENNSNNIPPTWKSLLSLLQVPVSHSDVDFALSMLSYSLDAFPSQAAAADISRLFELYDHIQERYWASEHRSEDKQKIRAIFSERPCIYIPDSDEWVLPDVCVWDAPQDMVTKNVLTILYGTCFCRDGAKCPHFSNFFVETIGIRASCTWQDYVDELGALKEDSDDVDTITGIYKAINALQPKDIDRAAIRETFEREGLIYASVDDRPSWHKPSQCVWSKAARLRGKVSLNEDYEDLEELFTSVLGVKQVDLLMAIDELKHAGSRQPVSVPEVKESIWTVNSLLASETRLPKTSGIMESSIFPIKYPDGGVRCGTIATEFFIVDREQMKQSFADKVKLLDFSLEEVVRLRDFIHWIGLQHRYLSHCTKEVTSFPGEGASPIPTPGLQIRHKAHSFLRVACHFNSPRSKYSKDLQCLYDALKNAKIFETDGVSSNLQVFQDGELHQVESSRDTMHIDEHDSRLNVYVPRSKDSQQYIFTNKLPKRLFMWMMTDPITQISESIENDGVNATRDILLTPYTKLSEALEENGIANIDIENTDEGIPELEMPLTSVGIAAEGILNLHISDEDDSEHEISAAESVRVAYHSVTASNRAGSYQSERPISYIDSFYRQPALLPSFESPTLTRDSTTDRLYVETLSRIINAGRQDSLPVHGEPNTGQSPGSMYNAANLGLRSASQIERDCKVGAAGELYVFELLSRLPGFSRNNWKSNMRKYVIPHPNYADMEEWHGRETSDIEYWDVQSTLTGELIENGFLARDSWEGKLPHYYIEVKSTTGSCDTPFYMSKAQYQRMQDNTNETENTSTIYVIFRVYWLGQENMGLEIYLDPESLRRSGQLKFQGELWTVVPKKD